MKNEDMIDVIQAHIDGKLVQYRRKNTDYDAKWIDCVSNHLWDFVNIDYRVKQEPRKFMLCSNNPDSFGYGYYAYEVTCMDDAEIERLKNTWSYTIEVWEDVFYEE